MAYTDYVYEDTFKATAAEKAPGFLAGHFPEFKRDKRPRYYVCDCINPNQQYARRNMNKCFAPTEVTPLADGTCPHCGHYALMVIDAS